MADKTIKLAQIALLVAMATVINVIENLFFPPLLPWLRIGLANIITLIALIGFGLKIGLAVAFLRSFLGGLMQGTFLGPAFFLSLAGACSSALIMGLVLRWRDRAFSLVGISIIGSEGSNIAQLLVVYSLINHQFTLSLLPFLLLSGLVSGFLNGLVIGYLDVRLRFKEVFNQG